MFQQLRMLTSPLRDSFGPQSAPTWKGESIMLNAKQLFSSKNAMPVLDFRALLGLLLVGFGLLAVTENAFAFIIVTGTVGTSGKYLVSGMPVTTTTATVLKLSFENKTSGTNL